MSSAEVPTEAVEPLEEVPMAALVFQPLLFSLAPPKVDREEASATLSVLLAAESLEAA
ncbi:MAG: hypothetical protein ACKPKO_41200 [Candidatus Fonsibacter sp.]